MSTAFWQNAQCSKMYNFGSISLIFSSIITLDIYSISPLHQYYTSTRVRRCLYIERLCDLRHHFYRYGLHFFSDSIIFTTPSSHGDDGAETLPMGTAFGLFKDEIDPDWQILEFSRYSYLQNIFFYNKKPKIFTFFFYSSLGPKNYCLILFLKTDPTVLKYVIKVKGFTVKSFIQQQLLKPNLMKELIFKKLYHEEPSLDLLELGINHKLLEQGFGCVLSV